MQNTRNFDLLSLLPSSLQSDAQVIAACSALEGELQAVSTAVDEIMIVSKLDTLPAEVIDHLAWQWHVDFYEDSLALVIRRALVKKSIPWHRRKGTKAIVQEYVSTVLSNGVVTEWFDYGGSPYHFRVQTDEIITDATVYERLTSVINAVKNVRSWLDALIVNRSWNGKIYVGGITVMGRSLTLSPVAFKAPAVSGTHRVGCAIHAGKILSIREVS